MDDPEVHSTQPEPHPGAQSAIEVLRNRRFLALWLAQVATQVGGNVVLYALTLEVYALSRSNTAVSLLLLTFLVPAVLFSAIAGVFVDRLDRRLLLIVTNLLRAVAFVLMFVVGDQLFLIFALTIFVSTATTFFTPAESAMMPLVVEREQLMPANGIFIFTLQASFALGFAILGPLLVNVAGTDLTILLVAVLYLVAAGLCLALPVTRPIPRTRSGTTAFGEASEAVGGALAQLRDGLWYVRGHRSITWPLVYLGITASLIGVLGVLGPDFATKALNLTTQGFVVVVLPLALGLVMGIFALNAYGRYLPRRRAIEGGLLTMAGALAVLALAGWGASGSPSVPRINIELGPLVSLLSIVVVVAFVLGVAYAFVAVPAQTQLQEELPAGIRGRVFGVLNMLVSVASFLPIIIAGPAADLVGTPLVILVCAVVVAATGFGSLRLARPLATVAATPAGHGAPNDPIAVTSVPLNRPLEIQFDDGGAARGPATDLASRRELEARDGRAQP